MAQNIGAMTSSPAPKRKRDELEWMGWVKWEDGLLKKKKCCSFGYVFVLKECSKVFFSGLTVSFNGVWSCFFRVHQSVGSCDQF